MSNEAAWLPESKALLQVGPAPMYSPGPDEVVIRIHSVAINPMEVMIQRVGMMLHEYPAILGADGAGEIYAVGSDVNTFTPGHRVLAAFDGVPPFPKADHRRNSFQRYAVAKAHLVAKIPDDLTFNDATVLPLCISSAADGLFADDEERGMGLMRPQPVAAPEPNGQVVLVWGGSSSVGACAIQLLVSAGYEVGAVAGAKNLDECRSLGAKHLFDRSSPNAVAEIVKTLVNKDVAGLFCCLMTDEAVTASIEVYTGLGSRGRLGSIMPPGLPINVPLPVGLEIRRAHGSYVTRGELGHFIWTEWMPAVLSNGFLKCSPKPLVCGKGLDQVQGAIDKYSKGVSGQKIVVEIV